MSKSPVLARALREPLVHFFVLGCALFALYGWVHRDGFSSNHTITVSRGQVDSLREQFARLWQRDPTSQELQGLIDGWVREEVMYREGVAMGLDRDDPVVRRRLEQKVAFIADTGPTTPPDAMELQQWLDAHADRYRRAPTYAIRQIYFDPGKHGERIRRDVEAARTALAAGRSVSGDVTMLPNATRGDAAGISKTFGSQFADALARLPVGEWQGPVESGFGAHLVLVTAHEPGRTPTLDEVRDAVERDFLHSRSVQADQRHYDELRKRYTVRVEGLETSDPRQEPRG